MSVVVPAAGTVPPSAGPAPEPQNRVIRIGAYVLRGVRAASRCAARSPAPRTSTPPAPCAPR